MNLTPRGSHSRWNISLKSVNVTLGYCESGVILENERAVAKTWTSCLRKTDIRAEPIRPALYHVTRIVLGGISSIKWTVLVDEKISSFCWEGSLCSIIDVFVK